MSTSPPHRLKSAVELAALAHPLRLRVFYALADTGPATAADLATALQEPPSLISYHLRKLHEAGLTFEPEAPDTDQRRRWWQVNAQALSFSPADFATDSKANRAARAVQQLAIERQFQLWQHYQENLHEWGPRWEKASFTSDRVLTLTPQQAQEMHQELEAVLDQWASVSTPHDEQATLQYSMHAFPIRPAP